MTIHDSHPFADPEPDPVRRLRGRLGGAVTLWTAGTGTGRAGLTVTSVMVAHGEPGRVLALLDPDADLTGVLEETGRGIVSVLSWRHRQLAEAFAGTSPAPGGAFRVGEFRDTDAGPELVGAEASAQVALEDVRDVGWSRLVTCTVRSVAIEEESEPLLHRRGRWVRPPAPGEH